MPEKYGYNGSPMTRKEAQQVAHYPGPGAYEGSDTGDGRRSGGAMNSGHVRAINAGMNLAGEEGWPNLPFVHTSGSAGASTMSGPKGPGTDMLNHRGPAGKGNDGKKGAPKGPSATRKYKTP